MPNNYLFIEKQYTVADATAVEIALPASSKEHLLRFDPAGTTAYVVSHDQARAAAGGGFPFADGDQFVIDSIVRGQSVWIYQTSGGPLTLHHAFLRRAGGS